MDRILKLVSNVSLQEQLFAVEGVGVPKPGAVSDRAVRIAEALLFAASAPLSLEMIAEALPRDVAAQAVIEALELQYRARGVNLMQVAGGFSFRTAPDLSFLISRESTEPRKLGRAAIEILAIIAYHQPVTRAEIEEIRGVSTYRGTLDFLLESGWIKMRGRRRTPGRPVTYGTTPEFLSHFNLDSVSDLPGMEELKGAGFLEGKLPAGFHIPSPSDDQSLGGDEDALEEDLIERLVDDRVNEAEAELDPDDDR